MIQKPRNQGAVDLQQISADMIVYSTGNYMYCRFLCTILADLIVTHLDRNSTNSHSMGTWAVTVLDLGKKYEKFNILKARDIHKATTTESNFSNLTPNSSLQITVLIWRCFCCQHR